MPSKRCAVAVEQKPHAIQEQVFQTWPPARRPDVAEGGDDVCGNKWPTIGCDVVERIEAGRMREVGRIEVDAIGNAMSRQNVDEISCEIAVRIEQGEAATGAGVGQHERQAAASISRCRSCR